VNAAVDTRAHEPIADRGDIEAFLGRLSVPSGQFLEVRCVTPDVLGAKSWFCESVTEATNVAQQRSGHANVYVGACPRFERRGTKDAVRVVPTAWADLDFHQIDPHDRERAENLALERLNSLDRRPTILVHSGNGLQPWWLYHQPIEISEAWRADRLEAINRGLARVLGGDAVHDLARVLRVPGTLNLPDAKKRSRGCVPVVARLMWADGPGYRPGDFDDLAVEIGTPSTSSVASRDRVQLAQPSQPDREILDAFRRLLDQLGSGHPLCRTWRGDRLLSDTSRSAFDMALVNQLVRARIRDEFIPTIVRAYQYGRGVFATDDYIGRTLAKAKAYRGDLHGAA